MAKRGRKPVITLKTFNKILEQMYNGKALNKVLRDDGMPSRSGFYKWLNNQEPKIADMYALAKEAQADYWIDECLEIADDGKNDTYTDDDGQVRTDYDVVHRSRLRVDTRKWIAGRFDKRLQDGGAPRKPETITIVVAPKPADD